MNNFLICLANKTYFMLLYLERVSSYTLSNLFCRFTEISQEIIDNLKAVN